MIRGRVLDRYDVWGQLSAGGMSRVFLAKHERLAMPVVIKTVAPELAHREDVREAVHRSARLMARVAAPEIVRVVDVGDVQTDASETKLPCLVEEYVDGIDLAELDRARRVALRRALPLWAVAEWTSQAARGLHAAHQAGVIHRDVKPANVFLHDEGRAKVGDFGVAVEARAERQGAAGTLDFMAPEQLLGDRTDRRTDLWSLGATAFMLRYGETPFESTQGAVAAEVVPRFPPPTSPEEAFFQHVLARLLAVRKDARPHTARTVSQVLRKLARTLHPRLATRREGTVIEAGHVVLRFEKGDIADVSADAIVNSAYTDMSMDRGVGAALVARGGRVVADQAARAGERALGECVPTTAGTLDAKAVLHAVSAWNQVSCVARSMHRVLALAEREKYTSIAVPALGTGRGNVSVEASAQSIAAVIRHHLLLGGGGIREVRFVLYDDDTYDTFQDVVSAVFLSAHDAADPDHVHEAPVSTHEDFHAPTLFADGDASLRESTLRKVEGE